AAAVHELISETIRDRVAPRFVHLYNHVLCFLGRDLTPGIDVSPVEYPCCVESAFGLENLSFRERLSDLQGLRPFIDQRLLRNLLSDSNDIARLYLWSFTDF